MTSYNVGTPQLAQVFTDATTGGPITAALTPLGNSVAVTLQSGATAATLTNNGPSDAVLLFTSTAPGAAGIPTPGGLPGTTLRLGQTMMVTSLPGTGSNMYVSGYSAGGGSTSIQVRYGSIATQFIQTQSIT